jgi:hypothetical protein
MAQNVAGALQRAFPVLRTPLASQQGSVRPPIELTDQSRPSLPLRAAAAGIIDPAIVAA